MASNKKTAKRAKKVTVDDVVVFGVMEIMKRKKDWAGTMTQLGVSLNAVSSHRLPGSPSALRVVLNRVQNRLRSRGISVKFGRTPDSSRTRYVRFATR